MRSSGHARDVRTAVLVFSRCMQKTRMLYFSSFMKWASFLLVPFVSLFVVSFFMTTLLIIPPSAGGCPYSAERLLRRTFCYRLAESRGEMRVDVGRSCDILPTTSAQERNTCLLLLGRCEDAKTLVAQDTGGTLSPKTLYRLPPPLSLLT